MTLTLGADRSRLWPIFNFVSQQSRRVLRVAVMEAQINDILCIVRTRRSSIPQIILVR
jgi:hypothetical protein